jgi:hypothetical protein
MEFFNKVRGVIWIVKESLIAQYGHSEPAPTSVPSAGCPLLPELWMNLNWVNI